MKIAAVAILITSVVTANALQTGIASVYGPRDSGGLIASNGERISQMGMTAASLDLPIGSLALVENRRNGRHIIVRINDHGPYKDGRIIDLTKAGAEKLALNGLGEVTVALAPCLFDERFNAAIWTNKPVDRPGCSEETP